MATTNYLAQLRLPDIFAGQPNCARLERYTSPVRQDALVFPDASDTEAIWEIILPDTYAATTGLTLNVLYAAGQGVAVGAVVFDFAVERFIGDNSGSVITANVWGTPGVLAANTVSTNANRGKYFTLAVVKANFGNGSAAAGERIRIRLRRLGNSSATDTLLGDALVLAVALIET